MDTRVGNVMYAMYTRSGYTCGIHTPNLCQGDINSCQGDTKCCQGDTNSCQGDTNCKNAHSSG